MNLPFLRLDLQLPLDRFTLELKHSFSHRVSGIFGPSGSGKTSVLECIAGLRSSSRGQIQFGEEQWEMETGKSIDPAARRIGYVPQDHLLFPHLSVEGNLLSSPRAHRGTHFAEVVELLELGDLLKASVLSLSGGEKQRVALGRALASNPRLLLLDEPLASLDLNLKQRILPFLLRIRDTFSLPMVIVSHNPLELQVLCDEVLFLRDGQIQRVGKPLDIFTQKETYGAFTSEGFENILSTRLIETGESTDQVELGGQTISIPKTHLAERSALLLGLSSRDIILALRPVEGLSARNTLRAKIVRFESIEQTLLVVLGLPGQADEMVVEITAEAARELSLEVGMDIFLLFKTSSLRFLSRLHRGVVLKN